MGSLCKLAQQRSISAYLNQFEMLANRIIGLSAPFLLSCFVSGLAPEIRREVQALHPLTLVQVAGLARLQEEKLADQRRSTHGGLHERAPTLFPLYYHRHLRVLRYYPPLLNCRRRLSPKEITMRREKGLCFNCDKKFTRGHKCSSHIFLLIEDPEEERENLGAIPNIDSSVPDPPMQDPTQAQISFYALSGHLAPETLRLLGRVSQQNVVILIDGGSTHNFV